MEATGRYNDKSKTVDSIIADIKQLSNNTDDPSEILHGIKVIERAHRDLKSMGLEKEINNSTIVSLIEQKLPAEIEKEWIKIVTGEKRSELSENKFPALLELLLQFKERIEYRSASLRARSSVEGDVNAINEGPVNKDPSPNKDKRVWCWLHPDRTDHPIWRCKTFAKKSPAEKVELVRKHRACFSYLSQGHTSKVCKRNFTCKEEGCGMPHHHLLHEAHASGISFHGTGQHHQNSTRSTNILLQLPKVKISKCGGGFVELNVLWDCGSTLSFITFRQARRLKLIGEKIRIEIVKVGGVVENWTRSVTASHYWINRA